MKVQLERDGLEDTNPVLIPRQIRCVVVAVTSCIGVTWQMKLLLEKLSRWARFILSNRDGGLMREYVATSSSSYPICRDKSTYFLILLVP